MDDVTMDDGLDRPETLVLGLGVPETAALVVTLLGAWAGIAALPAWLGWPVAVALVAAGAALGWGRLDDRTLLAWAVLAAWFAWRRRHALRRQLAARVRRPRMPVPAPADVVVPLVLPRPAMPAPAAGARVVGFFSLRGGSGRSALACALAAHLAGEGRLRTPRGWRALRVALLDLDTTLPGASLAWGATLGGPPRRHVSGVLVHPAPLDDGDEPLARLAAAAVDADVVVVDARWHEPGGFDLLRRCDDIVVLVAPTAAGVLDGYRSVAWLRRVGLRERVLLVANRCAPDAPFAELEDDLGLRVHARVPESDDLEMEPAVAALAATVNQRLLAGGVEVVDAAAG